MATFTFPGRNDIFPVGTVVKAYPVTAIGAADPSGPAPTGAAVDTQTMTKDGLVFTGLVDGARYWMAGDAGGGRWRWVAFSADEPPQDFETALLGYIPRTIVDAKGDVIGATTIDTPARVGVGADGQVLTANSAQSSGLSWTTPEPGGLVDSIFNVKDYGAVGDGSVDDTSAVQACLDASRSFSTTPNMGNGIVYFPEGIYKITSGLSIFFGINCKLFGAGGRKQFNAGPTLRFTPSSGTLLNATQNIGLSIENLRFEASHASFSGTLLDLSGPSSDTSVFNITGCAFTGPATMSEGIKLNKTIIGSIEKNHFYGGTCAIRAGTGNYVVGVDIVQNTYNNHGGAPILVREGAESITIDRNVFEAPSTNQAGALKASGGTIWGLNFTNNWCGDAGSANGSWVEFGASADIKTGWIMGNRFQSPANPTYALKIADTATFGGMVGPNFNENCRYHFGSGAGAVLDFMWLDHSGSTIDAGATRIRSPIFNNTNLHLNPNALGGNLKMGIHLDPTTTPQYNVDLNGQMRLLGTQNGIHFGGGSSAADSVASIYKDANSQGVTIGKGDSGSQSALIFEETGTDNPSTGFGTTKGAIWLYDESGTSRFRAVGNGQSGAYLSRYLTATTTWDPPSVNAGAQTTTTISVTSAAVGDPVEVGFDKDLQGMQLTGYVSSSGTVTVVLRNGTAGAIDLASGTLRAMVLKH